MLRGVAHRGIRAASASRRSFSMALYAATSTATYIVALKLNHAWRTARLSLFRKIDASRAAPALFTSCCAASAFAQAALELAHGLQQRVDLVGPLLLLFAPLVL